MKIIMETVFGSHLYHLDTPQSDKDFKGIFLPEPRDIILGKAPKCLDFSTGTKHSKNTANDTDRSLYSLTKFISLACDGDTVAIDMLHGDDSNLVIDSPIWQEIRKNRHKFYTKRLTGLFDYVRKQASKYGVKGSRLAALREVVDVLKEIPDEDYDPMWCGRSAWTRTKVKNRVGWVYSKLPINEFCDFITTDCPETGLQEFYEVLGRKFQLTVSIGEMKKSVYKLWEEYGDRARQAEANQGIDYKALSHALRGGYQLIEIFSHGDFTYPLPKSDLLLAVKAGKVSFKDIQEELEAVMQTVEILAQESEYPEEVDRGFWEDFVEKIYSEHVVSHYKG